MLWPSGYLADVGVQDDAAHDDLVQQEERAVRVEDEVQLADVAEALVQRLDEDLDEVEDGQLGLGGVAAEDEVESGKVTEHELAVGADQVAALHEVAAVLGLARHQLERLGQNSLLSARRQVGVELAEPRLAVVVEHEDGVDHNFEVSRDQNVNRRRQQWAVT